MRMFSFKENILGESLQKECESKDLHGLESNSESKNFEKDNE